MKVLVTGGSGLIGSHTVEALCKHGHEVIIVDRVRSPDRIEEGVKFYQADICTGEIEDVFLLESPDFVIHLAAQVNVQRSLNEPYHDAKLNIMGTVNLLDHCVKHNVKKIVFASTAAVYGEPAYMMISEEHETAPTSFYGISKLTAENYIQMYATKFGLDFTILRYANVYGMSRDSSEAGVVSIFIDNILNHRPTIIYGDGEQTRDFVFVKDVAQANCAALLQAHNEILNISSNYPTTVNQLFYTISHLLEIDGEPQYKPRKSGENQHSLLNNERARQKLQWEPSWTLADGLREIIECYKSRIVNK